MKKILIMFAAIAALALASCGSQKNAVPAASKSAVIAAVGQHLPDNPCYVLAEEAPAIRKVGSAINMQEAAARNLAEVQARSAFANAIATAIVSATEEIGVALYKFAGDNTTGQSVTDQSSESHTLVQSIASEIVRNTHPIKYDKNILPNGTFNMYVCIEYMGSENQMVSDIESKLKDKISAEDRSVLEERHDKFRQRISKIMNQ